MIILTMFAWNQSPGQSTMKVIIRPERKSGSEVNSVAVREEIRNDAPGAEKRFSIRAPITYASVGGIADAIESLEVRDAKGLVPLRREDDPADPGGFPFYRHWRAEREVVFPVLLSYAARPRFAGLSGPQFALQSHEGGISSAGSGFLVTPEEMGDQTTLDVSWDLSDLGPASVGVSTFGNGSFEMRGTPYDLTQGYFMAGPLGSYQAAAAKVGFSGYWLGLPPFEPEKEMEWTSRMYSFLRTFFRDVSGSPYRMFLRVLPGAPRPSGTALLNSFMLGVPARTSDSLAPGPHSMLAHELIHHWAEGLEGPHGTVAWFAEGTATHYQRLLPLRAGLISVDAYGESINATARGYYSNPYRNLSADSLGRLGFMTGVGGGSAQNVAYTRGSLYFADLDAQIRRASNGKRKLDDILLPFFDRIRGGQKLTQDDWVKTIVAELGTSARERFEAIIVNGDTIVPDSGAFGPCFARRPVRYQIDGKEVDGFEWVRVTGVEDSQCREW